MIEHAHTPSVYIWGFPGGCVVRNPSAMQKMRALDGSSISG